jgi:hypothetical protein
VRETELLAFVEANESTAKRVARKRAVRGVESASRIAHALSLGHSTKTRRQSSGADDFAAAFLAKKP